MTVRSELPVCGKPQSLERNVLLTVLSRQQP
jgi:hypothetical protein